MGVLQLTEMRAEIASAMGSRDNVDDPRRDTWINMAYFDVASAIDFEDLDAEHTFATAASDHNYSGPSSPLTISLVRDETNDNALTKVKKSEFFRYTRATEDVPTRWTRFGSEILLWPTPDAIYNMSAVYKITPTRLSADADVTVLPGYVDVAIIQLATHYGFMAVGEDNRGMIWFNKALAYLQSRITEQDYKRLRMGVYPTDPDFIPDVGAA